MKRMFVLAILGLAACGGTKQMEDSLEPNDDFVEDFEAGIEAWNESFGDLECVEGEALPEDVWEDFDGCFVEGGVYAAAFEGRTCFLVGDSFVVWKISYVVRPRSDFSEEAISGCYF